MIQRVSLLIHSSNAAYRMVLCMLVVLGLLVIPILASATPALAVHP